MNPRIQLEVVDIYSRGIMIKVNEIEGRTIRSGSININLNIHAYQRLNERKIKKEEIATAIMYGYCEHKQGDCFYALTSKMVPKDYGLKYHRPDGLVVICDNNSCIVKTCYRTKDPVNHVKKKAKYKAKKEEQEYE
jgi:hypothetical protein